jgi:hypothetical protein
MTEDRLSIMVAFLKEEMLGMIARTGFMLTILSLGIYAYAIGALTQEFFILVSLIMILDLSDYLTLRKKIFYYRGMQSQAMLEKMRTKVLGAKFSASGAIIIVFFGLLTGILVYMQPQPHSKALGTFIVSLVLVGIPYMLRQLRKYQIGIQRFSNPEQVLALWSTRLQFYTTAIEGVFFLISIVLFFFLQEPYFLIVSAYSIVYFLVVQYVRKGMDYQIVTTLFGQSA